MIKLSYAERKSFGRENFQGSRTFDRIEKSLDRLKRAARTNNSNLWRAAENRFLDLIQQAEYEGLSLQKEEKYLREYRNTRPPEEIIVGLERLEKGREKKGADAPAYRHRDDATLRGICSSEVRRYHIDARNFKS